MDTIADILQLPIPYLRYLDWHKSSAQKTQRTRQLGQFTLFKNTGLAFEIGGMDTLTLAPDLQIRAIGSQTLISSELGEILLEAEVATIQRILAMIEGESNLFMLRLQAHQQRLDLGFLQQAKEIIDRLIGVAIIAPSAITELEQRIPGIAIVRLPESPYHIVRSYWSNMADVWAELAHLLDQGSIIDWPTVLRRLHITCLMGSNLRSFYKPSSPVSDEAVWPGQFRYGPTEVNYSTVAMSAYLRTIAPSLDINIPALLEVKWQDEGGFWGMGYDWGHGVWYLPPPAPFDQQWIYLGQLLAALPLKPNSVEIPSALAALALFHQRFVQLHPFECANQSLVMAIVNFFLNRWLGCCLPHSYLDFIALFTHATDYARYFTRAVQDAMALSRSTTPLYQAYKQRWERVHRFMPLLIAASDEGNIQALLAKYPDLSRDLLLHD